MSTSYDFDPSSAYDERLALPIEQAVLLWCMRVWVASRHAPSDVEARLQNMLTQLGAADAAPYFGGFMFALSHGSVRRIAINCVCRPNVSEDERALLEAFALAQTSRPLEALLLLRGLMTLDAAQASLRSIEGVGAALARAGRFLPEPEAEVRHFVLAAGTAGAMRAADQTLH